MSGGQLLSNHSGPPEERRPAGDAGVLGLLGAASRPKLAYTTRRAALEEAVALLTDAAPRPGDLVLARIDELGQHPRLELRDGRRAQLFPGDAVVVCYGNRYAPDQFEAEVPPDLSPCQLVAAGGVAARVLSRHASISAATTITPLGLLGDDQGRPLNLRRWRLRAGSQQRSARAPLTVAVVGTSMNSGKTTMAADVARGLVGAGFAVGAAKITGTGAGGDRWLLEDAGADPVLDFVDAGYASTYKISGAELERIFATLTSQLAAARVDAVVLEVADGIFQIEAAMLLRSARFAAGVDHLLFAAVDAAGAAAGVAHLASHGHDVAAIGGKVSSSPLGAREATLVTGLPVLDSARLRDVGGAPWIPAADRVALAG